MRGTWTTTSGGSDGGGLVLAVIAAAVLIGSGAASAIASAFVTIAIIVAVVIVLAVAGVIALLVYRARSEPRRRVFPAPVIRQVGPAQRPELSSEHKVDQSASRSTPAIGPPRETHLHFHVSPDELAAIMRRYTGE